MSLRHIRPGSARRIAAAALLPLVGAAVIGPAVRRGGPEGEQLPAVVDLSPSSVRRLVVDADGRRGDLTRQDRDWSAAPGTPPQSAPLLLGSEDRLFPMLAYRMVRADPADPQFGLAAPEAVIHLVDRAGGSVRLRVGAASFSGAGFYAGRDDDPDRLYLVPRATRDLLRSLATGEHKSSAGTLQDRAARYRAEREEAGREKQISPYLRQALDAGGQLPPAPEPGPDRKPAPP